MEEKTSKLLILMALKRMKGYGNKKIIDLVLNRNLDSLHIKFKKESLDYNNFMKEEFEINRYCKKDNIKIITFFDKNYPEKLKSISSPPLILFTKGNIELLNNLSISIVGSRKSSEKSLNWAYNAAKDSIKHNYTVVSGGAKGIDLYSHKGALDAKGKTICVLGSGFNEIYPKENKELIINIMKKGLVITEYPPNTKVNKFNLLERNRITSGLGDKLLIVTSGIGGGSMSQLKVALSQRKEIIVPHLSLGLEPIEGIKEMIRKYQVTSITSSKGIFKSNIKTKIQSTLLTVYS